MNDRENRIRDLRWRLYNARQLVEDYTDIAKRAEGRDDGGRSTSAHQSIASHRAAIERYEAELAQLEREPAPPTAR